MSKTLSRRGIEDSMHPKPVDPVDDLIARWTREMRSWRSDLDGLFGRFFGPMPLGHDTPRIRRTVTVLVEFNPALIDEGALAHQVLGRLMPAERVEVDGNHGVAWFGVRSHVWNTHETWEVTRDDG